MIVVTETMIDRFFDGIAVAKMLLDDSVQQGFIDLAVPDALWINDQHRAAVTYAQTR